MKKIFSELKPFKFTIIVIIVLLFVQAMSNLALPDYMSNIVNIGIQQQGIDELVPEAIRKSEMDKIKLFLKDDELNLLENNYILAKKSDREVKESYPNLQEDSIYLLKDRESKDYEELENFMGKAILPVALLQVESKDNPFNKFKENIPEGVDVFEALGLMSVEKRAALIEEIRENLKEIPQAYIDQGSLRYIINEYEKLGLDIGKNQINYILKIGLFMLLVALLGMVTSIGVGWLSSKVSAGFARNLREKVFKKVAEFSNEEFGNFSTASLITRSTNDIQQIQMFTSMTLKMVFFAPILGIGGIIRALETNTSMAWIVGLGVVLIMLFVILLFSFATPLFKKSQKYVDRLNLVTRESLTGMLVIRAFNNEEFEEDRFKKVNSDLTNTHLKISRIMIGMMPGMQLLMNGMILLIVWVGAKQIDQSSIQVGDMMAFMQYAMQIIMSFLMLSMVSIILPRAMVSIQRIRELLETEVEIRDKQDPVVLKDINGLVEFDNVRFRYPGAEECVLEDINFVARPGEMTAFIGSTGSGKSTIVNLIPRLYDVSHGSVKIDGIDIRDIELESLRENIGYVPQKGILFSGNIDENIRYGKNRNISKDDVEKSIEIAQAKDFVEESEKGLDSPVSQGGTNVSGGQRQRLSIARAIASQPKILIFDDSFSALDYKTDRNLRRALKTNMKNSTVLVVAQRINTIKDAENIIVLEEGKIVGQGKHENLLKTCEVYREIAMSQLSEEELAI